MRLFTEAELLTYETDLMKHLADNKALVCKRPVLRGTPTPGNADADLVAVLEPTGELADCGKELEGTAFTYPARTSFTTEPHVLVSLT